MKLANVYEIDFPREQPDHEIEAVLRYFGMKK